MSEIRLVKSGSPTAGALRAAPPFRVLRISEEKAPNRRRALQLGALAFAALAVFGFIAAFPGFHGPLQEAVVAAGYLSFVFLFRSAMRRWGTDWDAVWDRTRHRRWHPGVFAAVFAAGLAAAPAQSLAQQTLFNIPSADVLDKGKIYLEEDSLWRPQDPHVAVFTMRGVYGFGCGIEAGINVGGFVAPGRSTPAGIVAIKWQPVRVGAFALTAGAHGLFFLRGSRDGDPAGHFYTEGSYSLPTQTRITAGGWVATARYAGPLDTRGGQFAVEQKVNGHLNVNADWYTGRNGLGYFSPGVVSAWGPWTIYAAYSFKNGDSKGNAVLIELGVTF